MLAEFVSKCALCLLRREEVAPFVEELKKKYPSVEMALFPKIGGVELLLQAEEPLDPVLESLRAKFPTFFYGEGPIEMAVHRAFIEREKTLALAESCTGGAIAAALTAQPSASEYFLGSLIVYSNRWKEHFLQVSRTTLKQEGAVSRQAVVEMAEGLLRESEADYVAAISGIAGPTGASPDKPVGTLFIAVAKRGEKIDAGRVQGFSERGENIQLATRLTLGALWRRLIHNTTTFS